jgi:hypothetical protein
MKKKLHLIIILLAFNYVNAQEFQCDFVPEQWMLKQSNYSNRFQTIPDDGRRFVFNVKFHFALGNNSENLYNLNETQLLKVIENLNVVFNQNNIFFKYRGFNSINNSGYTAIGQPINENNPQVLLTKALMKAKFVELNLHDDNAINIYLVQGSSSYSERSIFLNSISTGQTGFYQQDFFKNTVPHEMGHYFGLFHLWQGAEVSSFDFITENLPTCIANAAAIPARIMSRPILFYPQVAIPENVTREAQNPNYNADIAGDRVSDTSAAWLNYSLNFCKEAIPNPDGSQPNDLGHFNEDPRFTDNSGNPNTSCYYCFATDTKYSFTQGNSYYTTLSNGQSNTINLGINTWQNVVDNVLTNCNPVGSGETYKDLDDEIHNYMSFTRLEPYQYTLGQATRMRESIINNVNDLLFGSNSFNFTPSLNLNSDGSPNIQPLYEPFQVTNNITDIVSTTDNGDGTARVCRNYFSANYKFQPGFDYEFPENQAPDLTSYNTTQTPLVATPAFNCPIKIIQLSQNIEQSPTVCRGQICENEPFLFGIKYSTQVLGSMNITVEELNEIQVKDPNLYDSLMSQYYHILKKITTSGAKVETLIYKQ